MLPDVVRTIALVAEALERLAVPYAIGGSVASSYYGVPRASNDVDIVAELGLAHVARLVRLLEPSFYADEHAIRDAVRERSAFNLVDRTAFDKVDVFVPSGEPWQQQQLRRRRAAELTSERHEGTFYLSSPEDTVLAKLRWYDLGARVSERQWLDVIGVLKVQQGLLDEAYLRRWAGELNLIELLEQAMEAAGP